MKINFSFSKIFDNDKLMRVLSVLIGIIVWFVVAMSIDPTGSVVVKDIPVNFDLTNTIPAEYGLSIIEGTGQTVQATIDGKRYKLGNLTNADFVAYPTLSEVKKPGEYTVDVVVKKVNERDEDYSVAKATQTIKLRFDTVIEKEFDLVVLAENVQAEEGFIREESYSSPRKLMVSGPKSEIDKIAKCVVYNDEKIVSDETLVMEGTLQFFDENNNKLVLDNTKHSIEKFEITVPIHKHKTVPLVVEFVNAPQGLDTSKIKYTMSDQTIEISGPKETVDEINSVSLGAVDLRNADIGSTFTLDVNLLASINNVNRIDTVVVTIEPDGLSSASFNIPFSNIITQNIPASYDIQVKTQNINGVKIVGNKDDIEKLAANDLIAVIDFNNFEVTDGSSRVPITIFATGNKFVWSVGEYTALISATNQASAE